MLHRNLRKGWIVLLGRLRRNLDSRGFLGRTRLGGAEVGCGAPHEFVSNLIRQEPQPGAECAERIQYARRRRRRTRAMLRRLRARGWRSQASPGATLMLMLPRPDRASSAGWLRCVPAPENPVRPPPAAPLPPGPPAAEA